MWQVYTRPTSASDFFWQCGRIMAIEPMEYKGFKLGPWIFSYISIKFLIDRVPSCRIFEFWDFGRIGNYLYAEAFQTSRHMSNFEYRSSSYACKSLFFLVRVQVKAKFWTLRPRIKKIQTVLSVSRVDKK
jgi:hypothetical protein